jgi:hypothetical protein
MPTLCEPKCQLSICDSNVKIAESQTDLTLVVYKGNIRQCDIELTSIAGDIVLTDAEILAFGAEGVTFKLQLRDENNIAVNFMYIDCNGDDQLAEVIRLRFMDCDLQNDYLYEICND